MHERRGVLAPSRVAETTLPREGIVAAVYFGLLIIVGIREGGFWHADAFVTGIATALVLAAAIIVSPLDRRSAVVVVSVLLLSAWWLVRAATTGEVVAFLPLGASMLAFAAGFAVTRPLRAEARQVAALGMAVLGGAGALIGFLGLIFRWFPMAMPAQGLWRLSTTLTYSDAAGLVLGVCLLLALGTEVQPFLVRVSVCLCAGGLLATQSRGAYVAFACACLVVPWRRYARHLVPLAAGAVLGVAAIASSPGPGRVPWLGVVLIGALLTAAAADRPAPKIRVSRKFALVGTVVALGVLGVVALLLHHEIGLRALAPSDGDRSIEWATAWHQWGSAPYFGVGPDRLLVFHAVDGTYAQFVHNEYLQIAADAGVVGVALLAVSVVGVLRVVRRFDVLASCASAALICWAVGAAFDFDWHLIFIGALGGWCAGTCTLVAHDASSANYLVANGAPQSVTVP